MKPQPSPRSVRGNNSDIERQSTCTPKYLADAVCSERPFDLDPFSNSRSHIASTHACWLERGDDGFGVQDRATGLSYARGDYWLAGRGAHHADASNTVWIQPPYQRGFPYRALNHYLHTRWVALLRFDPRADSETSPSRSKRKRKVHPPWFALAYGCAELVLLLPNSPGRRSFEFDMTIKGAGNTFPHALYYRYADDCPKAVLELCRMGDGSPLSVRKRSRCDYWLGLRDVEIGVAMESNQAPAQNSRATAE